jgi:three-Cys-motif partner protein
VLKNTPLATVFFDAFAGTGDIPTESGGGLLHGLEDAEPFIEGSARRALGIDPPFSRYVFVEKSKRKANLLSELKEEFPALSSRIEIVPGDANREVERFCAETNWKRTRAVLFLDPFGNQVEWKTIETIAQTEAIDLWYLFPAHLGVNRQISAKGEFDASKAASLDRIFGTPKWREVFVTSSAEQNLFGEAQVRSQKDANVDSITRFMVGRMKSVFKGIVLDEWLPLGRNGSHWYSLLFACANASPKATDIAERLARAVMKRK